MGKQVPHLQGGLGRAHARVYYDWKCTLKPRNCRRAVIGWAPSEIERENVQLCLHASLPPLLVATFLIYLSNPSL
ncbi:hypothetical protein KC320_g121 [Hortaea werneckii]|nr:hypothetical protein KC320_g121 [Hortaea werneckii]